VSVRLSDDFDDDDKAGLPLYQSRDVTSPGTFDQVAFPMAGDGTILSLAVSGTPLGLSLLHI
jgi:hypothetical protein